MGQAVDLPGLSRGVVDANTEPLSTHDHDPTGSDRIYAEQRI